MIPLKAGWRLPGTWRVTRADSPIRMGLKEAKAPREAAWTVGLTGAHSLRGRCKRWGDSGTVRLEPPRPAVEINGPPLHLV